MDRHREIAFWRLGILGPLISARLEHGDRRQYFEEAAQRWYQRPDGRFVRVSARTIEAWYHAYRQGGFEALVPRGRNDRGQSRAIGSATAELLLRAKRERPRRSIRRLIRMLERAGHARPGALTKSSVHRLLAAHGLSRRPVRGPPAERRSFIVEYAGDLWMGDAMHGPLVLTPGGKLRKSYLLSQIDVATRYLIYSYFALAEDAVAHEYGFKQAILRGGLPRAYYVDRGAAYMAGSLTAICAELGIHLLHTAPKDCEAKGAIERWHRTWREEVGDELDERVVTLDELNSLNWAWLGAEYHARRHDTTGREPRAHWLAQAQHLRALPKAKKIDDVFLHRVQRTVRKDATVRFAGRFLEVRAELTGQRVELRFDPTEADARPRVFVDDRFVCDAVPLDRVRNATRRRRRDLGQPDPNAEPSGLDPLCLIEREHYERTRVRADDETED